MLAECRGKELKTEYLETEYQDPGKLHRSGVLLMSIFAGSVFGVLGIGGRSDLFVHVKFLESHRGGQN